MIRCVSGLLVRRGQLFLTQRALTNEYSPGLWEAPAGKVEPGETDFAALRRELHEECRVLVTPVRLLGEWPFHPPVTQRDVHVLLYLCRFQGEPWTYEDQEACQWASPAELRRLVLLQRAVPSLVRFCRDGLLDELERELRQGLDTGERA